MLELLAMRPDLTALFINNNLLCLGALLALRELGLDCPKDISIVSFDDHPWAEVADPPLTVVRQPARDVGAHAANLLCSMLDGEETISNRITLSCELIERQSVQLLA